jgi:hypothetical protein
LGHEAMSICIPFEFFGCMDEWMNGWMNGWMEYDLSPFSLFLMPGIGLGVLFYFFGTIIDFVFFVGTLPYSFHGRL